MEKKKIVKRKKQHEAEEHDHEQHHPKSKSVRATPKSATTSDSLKKDPYPSHTRPTPQECLALRDTLLALHGFPTEFAKYRKQLHPTSDPLPPESVLDGLVRTVLSQNTTESNSQKAFASLKSTFPTWEHVCNCSVTVVVFYELTLGFLRMLVLSCVVFVRCVGRCLVRSPRTWRMRFDAEVWPRPRLPVLRTFCVACLREGANYAWTICENCRLMKLRLSSLFSKELVPKRLSSSPRLSFLAY